MTLLDDYVPVILFLLVALSFPLLTFFATRLFRPTHPTPLKDLTYECGELPEGEAAIQFHFQYYVFALIFVVSAASETFSLTFSVATAIFSPTARPFSRAASSRWLMVPDVPAAPVVRGVDCQNQ